LIKKIYSFLAPHIETHSPLILLRRANSGQIIKYQTAINLLAITMGSVLNDILILRPQFQNLVAAPMQDGFHVQKIKFPVLTKFLENKNSTNNLLPALLKTFYEECLKEFVAIRQLPAKLKNGNDKAIAYLEDCNTNGRILPQIMYAVKPLQFGRHKLQTAASEAADQQIQALMAPHQAACQDIVLTARKKLRDDIADFDVKTSCEEFAQEKWVALCGGDGSTNFYDRNYQIIHNVEASNEALESGGSAEVSMNIPVSAAIISAAYHKSGLLAAVAEAEEAVKQAANKKAEEEARAKLTAAQAAAANRPTAESEEAIEARLTKTITAKCLQELRKDYKAGRLDLNVPAVQSQSAQRGGTANRGQGRGRGRGHGNPGQANAGGQQPNRGRGRGRGGGTQPTSQGTHQHASNSRGRQPSRTPSRQRCLLKCERADRDWHKPSVNYCKTVATIKSNRRVHLAREFNCMDVAVSWCLHESRMAVFASI